ncbi:MAG: protein-glutamate O-methyltransferase CheR, partial [Mangrovibacterium sp.]
MNSESVNIKNLESRLLLEAIYKRYGYDFRSYVLSGMEKRLENQMAADHLGSIAEMIPRVLHDKDYFNRLLLNLSVTVTDLFRDPLQYKELRERVIPVLKTYPYINIWCAGCATGEEAYSMAILLKEENLLRRTQIYATDINYESLDMGKKGIYPLRKVQKFTENYNATGGKFSLSKYYTIKYNACIMNNELKRKILFSKHNLVNDGVFAEMHLIFC